MSLLIGIHPTEMHAHVLQKTCAGQFIVTVLVITKTTTAKLSHTHQRMKINVLKLHVKIYMKLTNVMIRSQNSKDCILCYAMYIKPKEVSIK